MPPITYPDLILAVTLSSRGFAFVRFEGPLAPFDWGISENKGRWMNASQLKRIQSIIERYHPTTLVIENLSAKRSPQVRARSLGLRHMAVASEMNACLYDRAAICPRHPARVAGRQWLDPRPLLIRKSEEIPHTPHLLEGDR